MEQFLAGAPQAVAREDGQVLFDFSSARYSVSRRRQVCAAPVVRGAQRRAARSGCGNPGPHFALAGFALRTIATKPAGDLRQSRLAYGKLQARGAGALPIASGASAAARVSGIPAGTIQQQPRSGAFAEPALHAGDSAQRDNRLLRFLGVNAEETQRQWMRRSPLAFSGWTTSARQRAGRAQVEGLKLFLPPGGSEIVRQRAANLNCEAAKWQLTNWTSAPRCASRSMLPTAATSFPG